MNLNMFLMFKTMKFNQAQQATAAATAPQLVYMAGLRLLPRNFLRGRAGRSMKMSYLTSCRFSIIQLD